MSKCPTCGTHVFEPGEQAEPDTTLAVHARLVAACRKLRVVGGGGCLFWDVSSAVIAEFDAALAACEEKP